MGAIAQESPAAHTGGWHWQVQSGVQLLGRRLTSLDADGTRADFMANERYHVGFSGWRDLQSHWALGMGLDYSVHHLRFDLYPSGTQASFQGERTPRHGLTFAPSIRWQQSADRGLFAQTASSVRMALGDLSDYRNRTWCCFCTTEELANPEAVLYEHRFTFGQEVGVGYLLPIAKTGAISLRASALCELRRKRGADRVDYPERPWAIQPGLELGWRWGK